MAIFSKYINNDYSVVFTKNGTKITCDRSYAEIVNSINDGKNIKFSLNICGEELKYIDSNVSYSYKLDKKNKIITLVFFECNPMNVKDRGLKLTTLTLDSKNKILLSNDSLSLK